MRRYGQTRAAAAMTKGIETVIGGRAALKIEDASQQRAHNDRGDGALVVSC